MAGEATNVLGDFPQTPGSMSGGPAFQVAVYVIVSMIVLVGIVYLLGKALSNRKLEEWAKSEFLQVFISAALVGGLFLLMAPGTGLLVLAFNSLVPAEGFMVGSHCTDYGLDATDEGTPICYASGYLSYLSDQIMSVMVLLFSVNIFLDILSKVAIDVIVVEITPLSGLSSIVQVFNSMLQSLLFLGIMVQVEKALLLFANRTALQIFLPIGVVLRTFFGTRRLGGALIALAVGIYIVFPLTISMNGIVVKDVTTDAYAKVIAPLTDLNGQASGMNPTGGSEMSKPGAALSSDSWTTPLENITKGVTALIDFVKGIPQLIMTLISLLVVQIVFLPILSIMLTLIAIKELAALFGSEINMSRFEV